MSPPTRNPLSLTHRTGPTTEPVHHTMQIEPQSHAMAACRTGRAQRNVWRRPEKQQRRNDSTWHTHMRTNNNNRNDQPTNQPTNPLNGLGTLVVDVDGKEPLPQRLHSEALGVPQVRLKSQHGGGGGRRRVDISFGPCTSNRFIDHYCLGLSLSSPLGSKIGWEAAVTSASLLHRHSGPLGDRVALQPVRLASTKMAG